MWYSWTILNQFKWKEKIHHVKSRSNTMILNRRARPKTYHEISRPNTLQKSAKRIASMANSLKREPPSTACIFNTFTDNLSIINFNSSRLVVTRKSILGVNKRHYKNVEWLEKCLVENFQKNRNWIYAKYFVRNTKKRISVLTKYIYIETNFKLCRFANSFSNR